MARPGDASLTRKVKSEIIRRELDTTKLEVRVIHGVAYLGGELKATRHAKIPDWKKVLEIIEMLVLRIPGIRGLENRIKWVTM